MEMSTGWVGSMMATGHSQSKPAGPRLVWRRILSMISRAFAGTQQNAENALRIEGKISLGPKKMLFLVGCGDRQFLIATGAETIASVTEVSRHGYRPRATDKLRKAAVHSLQRSESLR